MKGRSEIGNAFFNNAVMNHFVVVKTHNMYIMIVCCTIALLKLLQVNEGTTESLDRATICSSPQSDMLNSPFCNHSNSSEWALTGDFPGNQKRTGTAVSGDTSLTFAYLVIICYDGVYWGYCITLIIFIAEVAVVFSQWWLRLIKLKPRHILSPL